jgi:hypothetical protein
VGDDGGQGKLDLEDSKGTWLQHTLEAFAAIPRDDSGFSTCHFIAAAHAIEGGYDIIFSSGCVASGLLTSSGERAADCRDRVAVTRGPADAPRRSFTSPKRLQRHGRPSAEA